MYAFIYVCTIYMYLIARICANSTHSKANGAAFTVQTVYLWISMQADHQNALKHGIYSFVIYLFGWCMVSFINIYHTYAHTHTPIPFSNAVKLPNSSAVYCTYTVIVCVSLCAWIPLQQMHVSRKWFANKIH